MTHIEKAIIELNFLLKNIDYKYDVTKSCNDEIVDGFIISIIRINTHLGKARIVERSILKENGECYEDKDYNPLF